MKARFIERQPAVLWQEHDNTVDVAICINETKVTERFDEEECTYYEYDYNQFRIEKGTLEKEEVQKEPEKFLDYIPGKESEEKRLEKLERTTKEEMALINQQLIETNQQLTETQMGIIDLYEMMQGGNENE